MSTLAHADIFFFIASIGFGILFILGIIAMIMLLRVLHGVRRISATLDHTLNSEVHEWLADLRKSLIYRVFFGVSNRRTK